MRFTVLDPLTSGKESATISFEGKLADCIPLDEVEEECFHNGLKVDTKDLVVDNSSIVTLYAKPPAGGAIAAFAATKIGGIIIGAVISAILSTVVSVIFKKKPKKPKLGALTTRGTRREESPTYAFEGIQDTIAAGSPIPFMLGTGRKGGQIISTRVELVNDGKQQKLYMLLCLGHGELAAADGVSDVELNGTKLTSFSGVSFSWRAGTSGQSVMTDFEHSVDQTYYDGREFTDSSIIYTTKGDVERADIFVVANGLFHNTDQGDMKTNTSNYTIEFRVQGGGGWTLHKSASISGRTTNQKFSVETIAFPTKDTFEIRLTWTSAQFTDASFDTWGLSLHNIVERVNETRTYAGYALLGISAISTADLNGRLPNVTCIFKAKVTTPNGLEFTLNNAWCIREILSNATWGLGHRLTSGLIDALANSWQDLADHCDESIDGFSSADGSEVRHQMSYVGDRKVKGWDLVNDLLSMVDASLIFSSGKLKVVIDKTQTAAQPYSEANTVRGSLVISHGRAERKINTVNGRYFPESEDYVVDFVKVEDTSALVTESAKIEDIDLLGVARQSEAIRACSRFLKENIYRNKEYSWKSPVGAIVSEPGDLVKRQYFVSDFSRGYTGYVLSGNTKEIYLDRIVTLDVGKTYEIFIKHKSKNTFVNEDISNSAGDWGKIVLSSVLTLSADEGDMWIIGEKSTAIADVLLDEVTQARDGTFTLKGSNYNTNVYTIDDLPSEISRNRPPIGDRPPLPIESWTVRESIEILPDGTVGSFLEFDIVPGMLKNAGTALGGSSSTIDLSVDEPDRNNYFINASIQIIDGTGSGQARKISSYDGATKRATVSVNWSVNPDVTSEYEIDFQITGEYYGSIVEFSSDDAEWFELGRVIGGAGALPIRGQGTIVFLRLIPYTLTGKRNELALLSQTITTTGTDSNPSDVSNFSAVQINALLLFTWSNVTDLDIDRYEVRQGSSWSQSSFVGSSKDDFKEVTDFVAGAKTYLIKAIDRTGNESDTEASFDITLVTPNERDVFSVTDELASLSGTFDGLVAIDIGSGNNGIGLEAKSKYDSGHFWDTALSDSSASQVVESWDAATLLTGTYISQTFNLGAIAFARILADIEFQDSTGVTLVVEEQHSDDDISYSDWRIIGAGDQKWQYARLRITISIISDTDNPIIDKFDIVIDALVRVYRGTGVTVTSGAGVAVVFPTSYIQTPNIHITERSVPSVYSDSPSKTGFTLKHDGGGSPVVDYRSEGI